MSEHKIRLRGPWEALDLDSTAAEPFRLALPFERPAGGSPRRLRLVRKFGRPRSPGASPARLVLEDVEGLKAAFLNDEPLTWRVADSGALIVEVPSLSQRNTLRLEAEVAPGEATSWGSVAIVISE